LFLNRASAAQRKRFALCCVIRHFFSNSEERTIPRPLFICDSNHKIAFRHFLARLIAGIEVVL